MKRSPEIPLSEILARLANSRRDTGAWQLLYLRMWPFVVGLNFRLLHGSVEGVEDVSQEVFVRLLQYSSFETLHEPGAFLRYLRAVCTNVCKDYLQKRRRRNESGLDVEEAGALRSRLSNPKDVEKSDIYKRVLAQLKVKERDIIERAGCGYTIQEIADATGLSYSNVGVQIHRIRRKMRGILADLKRE